MVKIFNKRVSGLVPTNPESLRVFLDAAVAGKKATKESIALQLGFNTLIPRDLDWIVANGQCLDNLVPKISTVPHAGRGGFAQRFIAKGETVIIAPLLHIMNYESTFIYPVDYDEDGELRRVDDEGGGPDGQQLVVNYCFSHDETSMYLCPGTNAILINHCSTRQEYGGDCKKYNDNPDPVLRGANTKVRWANDWDEETTEWMNMSIPGIANQVKKGRRGLSFAIEATRDIHPGDEVCRKCHPPVMTSIDCIYKLTVF